MSTVTDLKLTKQQDLTNQKIYKCSSSFKLSVKIYTLKAVKSDRQLNIVYNDNISLQLVANSFSANYVW